jgi:hypothetical protein
MANNRERFRAKRRAQRAKRIKGNALAKSLRAAGKKRVAQGRPYYSGSRALPTGTKIAARRSAFSGVSNHSRTLLRSTGKGKYGRPGKTGGGGGG